MELDIVDVEVELCIVDVEVGLDIDVERKT